MSKILVVDDSNYIRKFVAFSLKAVGYKVVTANDGMEAMELLPHTKFDLVITDLNMPNVDGYQLVKYLRDDEEYKTVPIIILSSEKEDEDKELAFELGASAYVVKPFNPEVIQKEVAKLI